MPGRSTDSRPLQYVGIGVAVVAVIGTVALGWEWGSTDDLLPMAIGVGVAILAIGTTLYSRMT